MELSFEEIQEALVMFRRLGAETVEITGGGEPMMHPHINEIILYASMLGYEVGLITNGTLLDKLNVGKNLKWIRISANGLDYNGTQIKKPEIGDETVLGFSYVYDLHNDASYNTLREVRDLALWWRAKYVRVVPNCKGNSYMEDESEIVRVVGELGKPLFYQGKIKSPSNRCWIGYLKPFLNVDGYVYPCSSTVLNQDADEQFNPKYRWYHWRDAGGMYNCEGGQKPFDGSGCTDCVFTTNNEMFDFAIGKQECEKWL
jgi:MoaA/NifB/PqqE/SkfB family radical SAM enzyme